MFPQALDGDFPSCWSSAPSHGMVALIITSRERHPKKVILHDRGESREL